jgi:hypothetical protein
MIYGRQEVNGKERVQRGGRNLRQVTHFEESQETRQRNPDLRMQGALAAV